MKAKEWYNNEPVTDLPEYVRLMKNKTDHIRGESKEHIAGEVLKVNSHGKTLTLSNCLIWQRYSYKLFVPATKEEYDAFNQSQKQSN